MSAIKSTKKLNDNPKANQFENIKPIEVKCFIDENSICIKTEEQQTNVTAKMATIVPSQVKRVKSAPSKKKTVAPVTDMVVPKPIRHLAILPPAKECLKKELIKRQNNLSETFTRYDAPTATPVVNRSLDETFTIVNNENQTSVVNCQIHIDPKTNDTNTCDTTTISSVCELVDHTKLHTKPRSLIGRYQLPKSDRASTPNPPSVLAPTVNYNNIEQTEITDKQVLIQQFYTQLEKMKATFATETASQTTKNPFVSDNNQQTQILDTTQIKDNKIETSLSNTNIEQNNKKPPLPKKQTTSTKTAASRIKSAPVTMTTKPNTDRNHQRVLSCKQQRQRQRTEKLSIQEKNSSHTKDKPRRNTESAPLSRDDIRGPEITLLPQDEQECRHMYEKLQRLQPNGVCVDLNTLRRALYPPVGNAPYSTSLNSHHDQTSAFKSYRQRTEEMPQSWIKGDYKYVSPHVPKPSTNNQVNSNLLNPKTVADTTNIDRIADQLKKHAEINYSYYTRTK